MIDRRDLARLVGETPADVLPELIGTLAHGLAVAYARLVAPSAPAVPDEVSTRATASEIADKLNVPVSFVYELARQGRIPVSRFGRYRRFDLAAVTQALAAEANSKSVRLGSVKNRRKSSRFHPSATAPLPSSNYPGDRP